MRAYLLSANSSLWQADDDWWSLKDVRETKHTQFFLTATILVRARLSPRLRARFRVEFSLSLSLSLPTPTRDLIEADDNHVERPSK